VAPPRIGTRRAEIQAPSQMTDPIPKRPLFESFEEDLAS
jgi:hypothetical protein